MYKCNRGFTLIELLVSMFLAGIVSGVIYVAYEVQNRIHQEQDDVVQMQQTIRSGLAFLQREARMAGYNPKGRTSHRSCSADPAAGPAMAPGVHTATVNTFGFSMDLNGNGDCADVGENVLYQLFTAGGVQSLGRNDLTNNQAQQSVADDIGALEFIYLFQPPRVGSAVAHPPTSSPAANQLEDIRTLQVSVLAQAEAPARYSTQVTAFTLPQPDAWGNPQAGGTVINVPADNIRRRVLTTMINLRNRGL